MTSPQAHQRRHRDIPLAGLGGTYQHWLRYQEKMERRQCENKQEQAQRTGRNRAPAAASLVTGRMICRLLCVCLFLL